MLKINILILFFFVFLFFSCQVLKEPAGKIMGSSLPAPEIETAPTEEAENAIKPTYPLADYNLKVRNLDGSYVNLADYKGKVIFLNFWATWCLPCVAELPSINKMYNQLKDENIVFLLISNETFEKVAKYRERKKFDVPFHIIDSTGYIPRLYQSPSIPTTFIINKNGEIIKASAGAEDWNDEAFITELRKIL
ncbi:MAG: TlpA family protein disulfide reductase [Vicingaceae bacterium]|nr:TlpA family protein disulfide reductase [Vicingaceae bacterium]